MSAYRGRTGPNVSQYLTGLNTLSPTDNPFGDDNEFSNDLAMYTNTDFTNLDLPSFGEDGSFNFDLSPEAQDQDSLKYEELLAASGPSTDFNNMGAITDNMNAPQPQPFYTTYNTPIQPAPTPGFPTAEQTQQNAIARDNRRARASTVQSSDHTTTEDKSRLVAEEDKRRRNTAASARFRVKKKQREQALEKTLKETQDKNSKLEAKVSQLEMENKWLKELITEKNGLSSKEEMAAAYEQHRRESEERDLKAEPGHTSGVGTD
ncbi:hypothetical protein H2198_009150 [Neophaeococcomyces mojaviensis]|uniref:Uncharacterized protein n=1 Tax=Neophaeococcomyces mojaviensis TaxID=3383035 RepID=A0ACC2ZVG4_9EURO|nr:hypothetical protein H2198_009150 [Knufia sp. JES_112]